MTAPLHFEVWAPYAHKVEIDIAGKRRVLEPQQDGHWHIDLPLPEGACDYFFHLDGGPPLPDPRSPWQPEGVRGPSRTVDHRSFPWRHSLPRANPILDRVLYELHVGTFTTEGTFDAALDHLPHLVELGVTHLELMPVAEFAGSRGWGYDGIFLFAPHHRYGGPQGLKRFVDEAHGLGLRVLLDVVYSHLGPLGNPLPLFAPYLKREPTGWGDAMNLDGAGSDEVRRFLLDNVSQWLVDYRFDGLRLDAVHAFRDVTALSFLEELSLHVGQLSKASGREMELFVESDRNDPMPIMPRAEGGFACTALWNDDFHHALHAWLTGETNGYYADYGDLEALQLALTRGFVLDGRYSSYRRRRHG
ncbi:MAG: alpha-amylase family glycosyl hydrolase, partial [Myxococcota bacterium]